MSPVVVILGRPNVGKSTLFNRLVGRREAIVDPSPGVTRDRREGEARLGKLIFTAIDTAGFEDTPSSRLERAMQDQTRRAIEDADIIILLFDARAGITPLDQRFADEVRRSERPVIPVANKCESRASDAGLIEGYELGMGEPVAISSEHGLGMADLEMALETALGLSATGNPSIEAAGDEEGPLRMIITGRPNVGKSTLFNRLLGDERMITGPEPGTTRDAVAVHWRWNDQVIELVDTAGLRRKARVTESLEKLSVGDTLEKLRFAHVAVLVMDAERMPERQDLVIARHIIDEGRAVVLAVNKCDRLENEKAALRRLQDRLKISLPQIRGVPVVMLSARTGHRVQCLLPRVAEAFEVWNRRVPTGPLNRWLAEVVAHHPPPLHRGRPIRIRYITQSKARPPTFLLFTNRPAEVTESYVRYIANGLRDSFGFPGVPIRINLRKPRNPYASD